MTPQDSELLIPDGAMYATARQLAHRYQVSVKWIMSRAEHLGATPISDAHNSPLRYHVPTADAYFEARRRRPAAPLRRSRNTAKGLGAAAAGPSERSAPRTVTRTGAPWITFR